MEPLVLEYAVPWWRVAAYAATGLAALLVAVVGFALGRGDGGAKLVLLVVGLGALGLAVRDALLRPTLRADADGIEVVDGVTTRRARWEEVRAVRSAVVNRRMLVHLRTLELDLGDRLVVLSRRQLAHDPVDAAERLEELRPR